MEEYQIYREKAALNLQKAEQVVLFTYRLVNSPKLLLGVVELLSAATNQAMTSILLHERAFGRIPKFEDTFESKTKALKEKVAKRYNINEEIIDVMKELNSVLEAHKKSPIEFERKDRLVICNDRYNTKILTLEDIKTLLNKAKLFIQQTHNLTTQNDSLFT